MPFGASFSSEQLVSMAQDGDHEALGLLMTRCSPMIRAQAAKFCTPFVVAEDLSQEGFLALLSAVDTFAAERNVLFETYASVCVRNRMIAAVRKSRQNREVPLMEWESTDAEDGSSAVDPAALLIRRDEEERLFKHLREMLTDLEYQVLVLRLGSYAYEQIAEKLGVSEKSVDNAMQRVRRKLTVGSSLPSSICQ